MYVTMSMEEYRSLETKADNLMEIRRLARNILIDHCDKNDWAKWNDMTETMSLEETQVLMKKILES